MGREIEAKIALQGGELAALRGRLAQLGAQRGPVDDEQNLVLELRTDCSTCRVRRLRLRGYAGRCEALLTCKGPVVEDATFKEREEFEVRVSDGRSARELLEQVGFRPAVCYSKRREHWSLGNTVVMLDRLEFGDYVEIEGEEAGIKEALARLGLEGRPHIRSSYARLARRARKLVLLK